MTNLSFDERPFDAAKWEQITQKWMSKMDPSNGTSSINQSSIEEAFSDFADNCDWDYDIPEAALSCFMRDRYGWATPTKDALDTIASQNQGLSFIELGAGSGFVSASLIARGLNVVAYNAPKEGDRFGHWWKNQFCDIQYAYASQIEFNADAYIMIFPECHRTSKAGEDMMLTVLQKIPVGKKLILCAPQGCTGSTAGHTFLKEKFNITQSFDRLVEFLGDSCKEDSKFFEYVKVSD